MSEFIVKSKLSAFQPLLLYLETDKLIALLSTLYLQAESKPKMQVDPADLFDDYAEDDGDLLDAVTQAEGQRSNQDGDDIDDMDDDMLIPTQHRRIMQLQDDEQSNGKKIDKSQIKFFEFQFRS